MYRQFVLVYNLLMCQLPRANCKSFTQMPIRNQSTMVAADG